jgi:hypothetical protein
MVAQTLISEVGLDHEPMENRRAFRFVVGTLLNNRTGEVVSRGTRYMSTALLRHCGSRPRPCSEARLASAHITDGHAPSSVPESHHGHRTPPRLSNLEVRSTIRPRRRCVPRCWSNRLRRGLFGANLRAKCAAEPRMNGKSSSPKTFG